MESVNEINTTIYMSISVNSGKYLYKWATESDWNEKYTNFYVWIWKKKEKVKIMNQTTTMSANFFTDVLKLVI